MSFLGVKVILFLVIPLIIKEKSNASALLSPPRWRRGVNSIACCWRTGHGGHRPTLICLVLAIKMNKKLRFYCYLWLPPN